MSNLSRSLFCCLIVLACGNRSPQNSPANKVPKPLQDNASGYGSISKRGYNEDLVDALYEEQTEANTALKNLDEQITSLAESKPDSLAAFNKFDGKNKRYYESATSRAALIKDSLLRLKVAATIANSLAQYDKAIAGHTALISRIAASDATLTDLYQALKVVRTLPLIVQYQKTALPPTGPLSGFSNRLSKTVALADTLLKK